MKIDNYIDVNFHSLDNKNIVITGATGGLGKELCFYLARLKSNLIIIGRNINKLNTLKEEILSKYNVNINILVSDFLDFNSVKMLCNDLLKFKIDYFIHNAGAYCLKKENTSYGFNNVYQINYLVPYFISRQLLDKFKEDQSKIIIVNSIASKFRKINTKDLDFKNRKKILLYGNSKRWELLSLVNLFNDNKINYSICHPGITYTGITSNYNKFNQMIIKYPMKLIFNDKKFATLNVLASLYDECKYPYWIGPKWFNIWGKHMKKQCKIKDDMSFIYNKSNEFYETILNSRN